MERLYEGHAVEGIFAKMNIPAYDREGTVMNPSAVNGMAPATSVSPHAVS